MKKKQEVSLAKAKESLMELYETISAISTELRDEYDSHSESWQEGERGELMDLEAESLEEVADYISDAIGVIGEVL